MGDNFLWRKLLQGVIELLGAGAVLVAVLPGAALLFFVPYVQMLGFWRFGLGLACLVAQMFFFGVLFDYPGNPLPGYLGDPMDWTRWPFGWPFWLFVVLTTAAIWLLHRETLRYWARKVNLDAEAVLSSASDEPRRKFLNAVHRDLSLWQQIRYHYLI